MKRIKIRLFLVIMMAIWLLMTGCLYCSGCKQQEYNNQLACAITAVNESEVPFTTEQLEAMIGPPDIVTVSSELASLFHHNGMSSEEITTWDKYIYDETKEHYSFYLQKRNQHFENDKNIGIEHLTIWLYGYYNPSEVVLCGILPRKTGVCGTEYFLIDKSTVIAGSIISWRCPK